MSSPLTFITSNAHKLQEVKAILEPVFRIDSRALDLEEIQGSVEEIAHHKCRKAADLVNGPVLIEDTALCFNALCKLPGPYIKCFMSSIGHEGLNKLLAGYIDKSAVAVCTFAYSAGPGCLPVLFQGRCLGNIIPARGPSNFGWDPIFEYQGQTFAELDKGQKNVISHRARALIILQNWLKYN